MPVRRAIYVGSHPNYSVEANAKRIPGEVMGKPVTWFETTTKAIERETLIELPDTSLHLFLAASNAADAEALTKTASTLRDGRAGPPATARRRWNPFLLGGIFACAGALAYGVFRRRRARALPKASA